MLKDRPPALAIKAAGLRSTEVRARVFTTLRNAKRPLSHPELAARLADSDRVTVFRSLKALRAKGLLHCIQGLDGTQRYVANPEDAQGCPGGHPHFLCERCGEMTCLTDQKLPWIEAPRGSVVRGKQLLVYGLCAACSELADRERPEPGPEAEEK